MSRVRTRATRGETIERLFRAAADVFEERGIGGASIEAIAAAAGLTRGAIYSNFADKDELIIAMLEDHARRSLQHHRALLAQNRNPAALLAALDAAQRGRDDDPIGRAPLLHIELILYVARTEKHRPELAKRLRARRELMTEMIEGVRRAARAKDIDGTWAGAMLLAMEDGYRLHRLIDPKGTPEDSFMRAVARLQRLIDKAGTQTARE